MSLRYFLSLFVVVVLSVNTFCQTQKDTIFAVQSLTPVVIDGAANDACWEKADWKPISQVWIPYAAKMAAGDFQGKFKLAWDVNYLYILVDVVDDILSDDHPNPLQNWWDDDCVEVFVDENCSRGYHEKGVNANNAFAYHISTKYDAIDENVNGAGVNYKNNVIVRMDTIAPHNYLWEIAIKNYSAAFTITNPEASRVTLTANKIMGFSIAYCDNDAGTSRENFIGSVYVPATNYNDSYINADFFGTVKLKAALTSASQIEFNKKAQLVSVFPNPAHNKLLISRMINSSSLITAELHSVTGALVKSIVIKENQQALEIGDLMPGIYLLNIISDGSVQTERIVKK